MTQTPHRARKLAFALLPFALVVGSAATSACDGDEAGADPGTTPDGAAPSATADGATSDPGPSSGPPDAGTEEITQGGENLDPDAGVVDPALDAGTLPDGGAVTCNALTVPAAIDTSCASLVPVPSGGALVAGTYTLASVKVLAASTFCGKGFVSTKVAGTLELQQRAAGGAFSAQRATLFGAAPAPARRSESLTPGANNTTPLAVTTSCPANLAASSVPYSSYAITTKAGSVQHLVLRLPFGRGGEALYEYVK